MMTKLEALKEMTNKILENENLVYMRDFETKKIELLQWKNHTHYEIIDKESLILRKKCSKIVDYYISNRIFNDADIYDENISGRASFIKLLNEEVLSNIKILDETDFDNKDYMLNTRTCLVNLLTLECRKQTPNDFYRNITNSSFIYDYVDEPELFTTWIRNMIYDDSLSTKDNEDRFQSWLMIRGYLITGDNSQKRAFFDIGKPNTSKSTFIEFFKYIMGSYAGSMSVKTLMRKRTGDPTIKGEIVDQRDKRMLASAEPEKDDVLDGSFLKSYTGKDIQSLRKNHRDPIKFKPIAKFCISANYFPKIHNLEDQALRNRLIVIESNNPIPTEKQDPNFMNKLKEYRDEIFSFLVRYSHKYYTNHKNISYHYSFTRDLNYYLMLQDDPVVMFWNDCIEVIKGPINTPYNSSGKIIIKPLYHLFIRYLEQIGFYEVVQYNPFCKKFKELTETIKEVKKSVTKSEGSYYLGLRLKNLDRFFSTIECFEWMNYVTSKRDFNHNQTNDKNLSFYNNQDFSNVEPEMNRNDNWSLPPEQTQGFTTNIDWNNGWNSNNTTQFSSYKMKSTKKKLV